jgi:hypothetical protein
MSSADFRLVLEKRNRIRDLLPRVDVPALRAIVCSEIAMAMDEYDEIRLQPDARPGGLAQRYGMRWRSVGANIGKRPSATPCR